jgi:hypothetical protein
MTHIPHILSLKEITNGLNCSRPMARRITCNLAASEVLPDCANRLAEKDDHWADGADLMEAFKVREVSGSGMYV